MAQGQIIALGSVNADFQVRVDRRAEPSETLIAHDFMQLSGGKAANVAFLARRLGAPATLIARVGNDALREQALDPLREIGVNLDHVRAVDGKPTGVSMISVPPDGNKGIILASNANDSWIEDDLAEIDEVIKGAPDGSVLVVDYEVAPFIASRAIKAAHDRGLHIILDPSPTDRVDQDLFSLINYIVPDAPEAKELTDIEIDSVEHAVRAGQLLVERGIETACVKLKDGGCVLVSQDKHIHVPPVSVNVVDTTGAGDAYAGALAVAVLEGRSLPDAACFATAASHLAVTAYGSQPAYPTREQLDAFLPRLVANAHDITK